MMNHSEFNNITVQLHKSPANNTIEMAMGSIVGTRQYQQDTIYGEILSEDEALAVVCDGMGGLEGGEIASQTAVISLLDSYANKNEAEAIPIFLQQTAKKMDQNVAALMDENGNYLSAGTTIVAVLMKDGALYWLSVGDSKIYFIRNNEMLTVNREHNYKLQLDTMKLNGEISEEDYETEIQRGEALISYLGMGDMNLMDINIQPFALQKEDKILLCSDGLYKCLSENEISQIVQQEGDDLERTVAALMNRVETSGARHIDNTSIVMLSYNK